MPTTLTDLLLIVNDIHCHLEMYPQSVTDPDLLVMLAVLRRLTQEIDDARFTEWWEAEQARALAPPAEEEAQRWPHADPGDEADQ